MGQRAPIRTNDKDEDNAYQALGWARLAGLVEIHPD
jgi:hypothetical protein